MKKPLWFLLQYSTETLDYPIEDLLRCDRIGWYSQYWIERLVAKHPQHEAAIRRISVVVGMPELDSVGPMP